VDDSKLEMDKIDHTQFGTSLGTGLINSEVEELRSSIRAAASNGGFDIKKYGSEGISHLYPLWLLKYLPNMPACHISIFFDAQGPSNSITTGDTASIQAIGEGFRVILRKDADIMITGGAGSKINPLAYVQYYLLGKLVTEDGDSKTVYKVFDRDRKGVIVGEGSGILVLEELESAKARGARIHAELVGFGGAFDAYSVVGVHPEGRGIRDAMGHALEDASLSPGDIDLVIAHGLGTKDSDVAECKALKTVFGENGVPVTALKPMLGYATSPCGAFEAITGILAMNHNRIPPLINLDEVDSDCSGVNFVTKPTEVADIRHVLINAFGFGGQAASMIFRKYEE
jgi:3-oxoacyl-[acyl-carrier-protein] synthase II